MARPTASGRVAGVIAAVIAELDTAKVRYALIGGFAMTLRGVQRATMDLDFTLVLEDIDKADRILTKLGYARPKRLHERTD